MSPASHVSLERKLFLGFIRIHILYHAAQEDVFGVELMKELERHGYSISPGTLYPILGQLEREGYLRSRCEVVAGKVRKYYGATGPGRLLLDRAREKVRELSDEIMEDGILIGKSGDAGNDNVRETLEGGG